jgi:putative Mg2+ transporter-C (MgtC) family protein
MTDVQLLLLVLPKVLLATACGILLGWERELRHKVADIRTHVLVCVGAVLFTIIAKIVGQDAGETGRVIGQIVTGVGFLGAGVIFKQDDKVVGVTSAALIWLIASIGVLIGLDFHISGFVLTLGALGLMLVLQKFENIIK